MSGERSLRALQPSGLGPIQSSFPLNIYLKCNTTCFRGLLGGLNEEILAVGLEPSLTHHLDPVLAPAIVTNHDTFEYLFQMMERIIDKM